MKILAHDINIICASDDSDAVFAHSTTDDTIKKVPINDSILNITSPLPSNCLKALEAFETQIVISTCDGIWLWRQFGEWQNITSESSLDHAFVDENHILFVKSDDESIFHTRLQQSKFPIFIIWTSRMRRFIILTRYFKTLLILFFFYCKSS